MQEKLSELKPVKEEVSYVAVSKCSCSRQVLGDLSGLVQSIKQYGVLEPLIVTEHLEVLVGARRFYAARLAGIPVIPVLCRVLSEKEQVILEMENDASKSVYNLSPSELSNKIAIYYSVVKEQGKRNDLTSRPCATRYTAAQRTGLVFRMSARSVSRYLAVADLPLEFKQLLDSGRLSLRAAVTLSKLNSNALQLLYESMTMTTVITDKQATRLVNLLIFSHTTISEILSSTVS